uniref:Si:ch211-207n2.7 n=1 Tax=Salmo trutta TaxID=8032 RepID=A0A674E443_SALTR
MRWKKSACTLRRFLPDVWKPLVPLLSFSAMLLVMVLYALADRLRSFVADIFIPQYHYPFAVPITFVQVLVTLLYLLLLHAMGLAPLKPYSLSLGERLLVPSICGSAQAVLGVWAEASAHSGILITVITLTSVTITSKCIYSMWEILIVLECLYAPLALLLHSLSLTWLAKVAETERRRHSSSHTSPFDLYFTLMVNQSLVLGFLCLLHPEGPRALGEGSWHSLLFMGYLLSILLLGGLQHLLVDMAALTYSPLAAALLHTAHGLTRPLYSLLICTYKYMDERWPSCIGKLQ